MLSQYLADVDELHQEEADGYSILEIRRRLTFDRWKQALTNNEFDAGISPKLSSIWYELVGDENAYRSYLRKLLAQSSLPISFEDLLRQFPYPRDKKLSEQELQCPPWFGRYLMTQEIVYLTKLFNFPCKATEVIGMIPERDWDGDLSAKSLVLWRVVVKLRVQYHMTITSLGSLMQSINQAHQSLVQQYPRYNPNGLITNAPLSNYDYQDIHQAICTIRAFRDARTPLENERSLGDAKPGLDNSTWSLDHVRIASLHEGVYNLNGQQVGRRSYLLAAATLSQLSSELIQQLTPLASKEDHWQDLIDQIQGRFEEIPSGGDLIQDSECHGWYFYPRHSDDPDDHYRFYRSIVMDDRADVVKSMLCDILFGPHKKKMAQSFAAIRALPAGADYEIAKERFRTLQV